MNCWKRSLSAVSSSNGRSPERARSISASIASLRRRSSAARASGSVSVPSHICRSSSNRVRSRDSVPTKLRFGQRHQPCDRLLGARSQIELRLVGIVPVELAQPPPLRARPVVQIVERGSRKRLRPEAIAKAEQRVFERFGQIALREHAFVGGDERAMEKARDQRRMIRSQQAPCGMVPAEVIEGVVVEVQGATGRWAAASVSRRRGGAHCMRDERPCGHALTVANPRDSFPRPVARNSGCPHSTYLPHRYGQRRHRPHRTLRGRIVPVLYPDLYRRLLRDRRHRQHQDRPPVRERHGQAAVRRPGQRPTTSPPRRATVPCSPCATTGR